MEPRLKAPTKTSPKAFSTSYLLGSVVFEEEIGDRGAGPTSWNWYAALVQVVNVDRYHDSRIGRRTGSYAVIQKQRRLLVANF